MKMIEMTLFCESTTLFSSEEIQQGDALCCLPFPEDIVEAYYDIYIANEEKNSFSTWLDEYTATVTDGLFDFSVACGYTPNDENGIVDTARREFMSYLLTMSPDFFDDDHMSIKEILSNKSILDKLIAEFKHLTETHHLPKHWSALSVIKDFPGVWRETAKHEAYVVNFSTALTVRARSKEEAMEIAETTFRANMNLHEFHSWTN